jgi:hypothetical protein
MFSDLPLALLILAPYIGGFLMMLVASVLATNEPVCVAKCLSGIILNPLNQM